MFRFNNPDALLTLLLVRAAWALLRAPRRRALAVAGRRRRSSSVSRFNTKFLQAYLVLPAFALTYLIAAPWRRSAHATGPSRGRRLTVLLASGWWVGGSRAHPAAARPFIGGSTNNSAIQLLLGYDGLGRIFWAAFGFAGRRPSSGLRWWRRHLRRRARAAAHVQPRIRRPDRVAAARSRSSGW